MPTAIDWNAAVDPSELVRQLRDTLSAGETVVLPGDCGYLALWKSGARVELPESAVLAWGPDETTALGLSVPTTARRLMLRGWPAPLVVELAAPAGTPATANGFGRLRHPDHPVFDLVGPAAAGLGPVLVADTGEATAADAVRRLGAGVGLVVNAGEREADLKPTVVRVTDAGYAVVEAGAFPASEIERLAARIVLFVCTGNTCRSPLAEALAKKALADCLGCTAAELPGRGFWVLSAGVATYPGGAASEGSAAAAAELGADLSEHFSRPVSPQLLSAADDVIAMTHGHLHALAARYPGAAPAARLLCGDEDLDDPIGADADVYRACARTILRHLGRFLPEWVGS